jgi:hypothetical protein
MAGSPRSTLPAPLQSGRPRVAALIADTVRLHAAPVWCGIRGAALH